jgi:7-carboxy-7-deazaguanine synthase
MLKLSNQIFNVNEIFYSIQGEGIRVGRPCIFVRFQGCLLRCSWCDTPYALDRKQIALRMNVLEIEKKISEYPSKHLMLTGGEPLEQENISELIAYFCDKNFEVVIETNGQQDISKLDKRAFIVLDLKCPESKMHKKNSYENINHLKNSDEVKFVVASDEDFHFAVDICKKYEVYSKTENILFSPVHGKFNLLHLAEKIKYLDFPARMQVQLHKYIWDENKRGV